MPPRRPMRPNRPADNGTIVARPAQMVNWQSGAPGAESRKLQITSTKQQTSSK
jgi:hypothetical protein